MHQGFDLKDEKTKREKTSIKKAFLISIPLSLILTFFFFLFTDGDYLTANVGYVLGEKDYVKYDTFTLSFDENIPETYVTGAISNLERLEFQGKKRFEIVQEDADIVLSRESSENSEEIFSKNLIPVAHIYSLVNDIEKEEVENFNLFVLNSLNQEFVTEEYGTEVTLLESYDELVSKLEENDANIGLVEFSDLDFRVKILETEKGYYLDDREASIEIKFYAQLSEKVDDFILSVLSRNIDIGTEGWDEEKLTKVNMGGVVAIARSLAARMDEVGDYGYPAKEIGSFLADADLTHVSNEVSFVDGCVAYSGMRFCSKPEYIETLEKSGVDIVELTGNHNNDFGSEYNKNTIETYTSLGMRYFGGGLNSEDASKVLYEEVNGSTIAFVGYNYYDTMLGTLALAGTERAGANSYSVEKLREDIAEAKENADVVIVTFQFQECWSYPATDVIYPPCYRPVAVPDQEGVFKQAIDFGADIVVGTQAHQPQTYELYGEGIIFYGLGNLYFDQINWIGTRQGLVLSHYFYDGQYIQTKMTPILMNNDFVPEIADEEESKLLMELLKDARN
jgi:poly-gamma-glutamate capsule biosynthesis protein CapA/YwtB (metallophosphatase superfamily)